MISLFLTHSDVRHTKGKVMNNITVDLAAPAEGEFAEAWPKIVTAHLPAGGTSQAVFHADGRIDVTEDAPRVSLGK